MTRFTEIVSNAEIMRKVHNPGSPKMADRVINSLAGDILRMAAEIERLTAALATARNDALDEAINDVKNVALPKVPLSRERFEGALAAINAIRALKEGAP